MDAIKTYLRQIADTMAHGDAREESYYPYLKNLLEEQGGRTCSITVLPKLTEAGNPDFRVWDGKQHITGYIEAKTPGSKLDQIETSKQLKRYRDTFPNLMLTDFYEFRLYRNGQKMRQTLIGRPFIAEKLKHTPPLENADDFKSLLDQFFSFSLPRSFSAEILAVELAKRTRFLRDEVIREELRESAVGEGKLHGFFRAFKKYLIPNINETEFADLYSQTLTYGLFAARSRGGEGFTRATAYNHIPATIGILRDVFRFISLGDLSPQMEVIVDDIADVLAAAALERILEKFSAAGKGEDPILHFYETFLSAYDPKLREKRGVYYTPEPVAEYIVCGIHDLLKTHFGLKEGLADPAVTLLDPAAGTLTFLVQAIRLAVDEFTRKYGEGGKQRLIRNQILKNYYAFELMMAPYAIGHLKMGYLLEELGCPLEEDERFQLYLTNTLSMEDLYLSDIPGLSSLSEESHQAAEVKQKPILVILGNPPYSGISGNTNEWTEKLLKTNIEGAQSYFVIDGKPLKEKKAWLQDDYVKFLRFAQWKVQRAGRGIVGMITNHGYLDNPTFRGMRQSLMKTFNEIYVLNLHGSTLKQEKSPEGEKDENVFDIRPGVAIIFLVKFDMSTECKIYKNDLYGTRENKYVWLNSNKLINSGFHKIEPITPGYFFIHQAKNLSKIYQVSPQIKEIFPLNVSGIVTARDNFVIGFDINEIRSRINIFRNLELSDEIIKESFKLKDTRGWKLAKARRLLAKDNDYEKYFETILYRPFDLRKIYFNPIVVDWGRFDFMRHMLEGQNIALISARSNKSQIMDHFFITDKIIEAKCGERTTQSAIFPLYTYIGSNTNGSFVGKQLECKINIFEPIIGKIQINYGRELNPEEIFFYIYSILFSNFYRKQYHELLRLDYPRIPFTTNLNLFKKLAGFGKRLADIHLLNSAELDPPVVRYQGSGMNDRIERVDYHPESGLVVINDEKYFEGIEKAVWVYQIGGYQVLMKYLKDRKGRMMDDPLRYARISTALKKTIEIQKEIDDIYPQVEEAVIEF